MSLRVTLPPSPPVLLDSDYSHDVYLHIAKWMGIETRLVVEQCTYVIAKCLSMRLIIVQARQVLVGS